MLEVQHVPEEALVGLPPNKRPRPPAGRVAQLRDRLGERWPEGAVAQHRRAVEKARRRGPFEGYMRAADASPAVALRVVLPPEHVDAIHEKRTIWPCDKDARVDRRGRVGVAQVAHRVVHLHELAVHELPVLDNALRLTRKPVAFRVADDIHVDVSEEDEVILNERECGPLTHEHPGTAALRMPRFHPHGSGHDTVEARCAQVEESHGWARQSELSHRSAGRVLIVDQHHSGGIELRFRENGSKAFSLQTPAREATSDARAAGERRNSEAYRHVGRHRLQRRGAVFGCQV